MKTIRKQISVYDSLCKNNIIYPNYPYNTNIYSSNAYGSFLCDYMMNNNDDERFRSQQNLDLYNRMIEILRNGAFLEKKATQYATGCGGDDDSFISVGKPRIEKKGNCGPWGMLYSEYVILPYSASNYDAVNETYSFDNGVDLGKKKGIILISNSDYHTYFDDDCVLLTWDGIEYGGSTFLDFCEGTFYRCAEFDGLNMGNVSSGAPYINLPLMLDRNSTSMGVMSEVDEYDENDYDQVSPTGFTYSDLGYKEEIKPQRITTGVTNTITGTGELEFTITSSSITAESKLQTLRYPQYVYDDNGNLLPGIFPEADCNKLMHITFDDGGGIDAVEISNSSNYKSILFKDLAEEDGDYLVIYPNQYVRDGLDMEIPFVTGIPFNSYSVSDNEYVGDYITTIEKNGNIISFDYVLGGKYTLKNDGPIEISDNTGLHFREKYPILYGVNESFIFGGKEVEITYDKIDFDNTAVDIYNEYYNLSRSGHVSTLVAFNANDVWTSDNEAINKKLIKMEYLLGVEETNIKELDVTIDRGNAAAFENHFKLSECNTFEDLANYGNNFFNL